MTTVGSRAPALIDILLAGAAANPNGIALAPPEGPALSFTRLLAAVVALTESLVPLVPPQCRVVIVCENNISGIVALFAVSQLGGVAIPVNARFTAFEIAHVESEVQPDLTIYATGGSARAADHASAVGADPLDEVMGIAIHRLSSSAVTRDPFAAGTALVLFTSGTTGAPKGVMHGAAGLLNVAAFERGFRAITPDDRIYCALPLSHIFGLSGLLLPYLSGGAAVELAPRFDAEAVLARLAEGVVTHFFGVPTMYASLVAAARRTGIVPRGIVGARTGGSTLDPALADRAAELFGVPLANGYGATEISPICTSNGASGVGVGRPAAGAEVRIVDGADSDVAPGETGEVWVRGPHRMLGYYRAPDATAVVLRDGGWYVTGDLGFVDAAGDLTIRGRTKDVINRSGFNVYPAEIETVIAARADVARCAVIGVASGTGDEQIVAFVEPSGATSPDAQDLAAYVKERLTGYKRPSRYVLVDTIPLGPTGKVIKAGLARLLESAPAA